MDVHFLISILQYVDVNHYWDPWFERSHPYLQPTKHFENAQALRGATRVESLTPKFTHVDVHWHNSLLSGLSKIPDLLDVASELGMDSIALTDHGVMYGCIEFYKEAKKRGIKPIFGLEAYIAARSMHDKQPGIDDKRYHLTLIAKNNKGYKNLIQLSSKSNIEGFYYKPRVDKEMLSEHAEGSIAL